MLKMQMMNIKILPSIPIERFLFILLHILVFVTQGGQSTKNESCFGHICLPGDYDKEVDPARNFTVIINPMVYEIYKVDDVDFSIHISMQYGIKWRDDRIKINDKSNEFCQYDDENQTTKCETNPSSVLINADILSEIWDPTKSYFVYHLKKGLSDKPWIAILKVDTGRERWINLWTEMKPTITCYMDFKFYPFDKHNCYVIFQSLNTKMRLETEIEDQEFGYWMVNNTVLEFNATFDSLPDEMRWRNASAVEFPKKMKDEWKQMGSGWSCTGFVIIFKRKWSKQILLYYFPSALFVFSSWVSFLIPPSAIPGRVSLLVTLFLSLTTTLSATISSSPAVSSGTTALIIWIMVHYLFLSSAMIAFAFLLALNRFKKMESEDEQKSRSKNYDGVFLICFPIVYIVFNVVYWCYYLIEF